MRKSNEKIDISIIESIDELLKLVENIELDWHLPINPDNNNNFATSLFFIKLNNLIKSALIVGHNCFNVKRKAILLAHCFFNTHVT